MASLAYPRMRENGEQAKCEGGGAGGGEEVHRIVVEPGAAFQGCAQHTVKEQAEDATGAADPEQAKVAAQGDGSGEGGRESNLVSAS